MSPRATRHLVVVAAVLAGALVCYAAGIGLGITLFFVAGAGLEIAFWILALTSPARSD